MRKKLPPEEKRNNPIGIKVKTVTREQLNYIASLEGIPLSTHIDNVLKEHIEKYFTTKKINWENLSAEEKGGK